MSVDVALPRIKVLMATYNGEKWIDEQLHSIFQQKNVSISIIVSDDGSKDSTIDIISKFRNQGDAIELVPHTGSSGGAGQNFLRLFRQVDFRNLDYVAFSDQDDVWYANKMFRAVSLLRESNSNSVGYSSSVDAFWPDGSKKKLLQNPIVTPGDYLFEGAGQGCTFVLTADMACQIQQILVEHADLTRGIHYHDWLIYSIVRSLGGNWIFDQTPGMKYRQHAANDTGARVALSGIKLRLRLIKNGWYVCQINLILNFLRALDKSSLNSNVLINKLISIKSRKVPLVFFLVKNGRRKISDRLVLVVMALFGLFQSLK